jgi:two-component system phosphate regulon sensor histidine kinase PhoR
VPRRWVSHLANLGIWLLAALLLGVWFGRPSWWLAGAAGLWLAMTLHKLYDLDRVLDGNRPRSIMETTGLWAELLSRVERYKHKASDRKKKYHRLLREVRESTSALNDAGIILNRRNEIQWFNSAATRLLGLEASRDTGQRIDNLIRHPAFIAYLSANDDREILIPSPRETTGRLAVQVIPYSRQQRLAIFRDVTREFRLERTRRDFVANASHELRSPLTVLSGYLDTMVEDDTIPAGWRNPLDEMQRQAARMTSIIRDLLELSRLESTEAEAPRNLVDVGAALRAMQAEFSESAAHLSVTIEADDSLALLGDETQLHSVFYNLINNAVRFTPERGHIDVYWKRVPGGALFSVKDTGIGIPDEFIPRVTERFFRVDPGRSRASGGTGLGLAIVKHVLQKHGARLSIDSEVGRGSVFSCQFPEDRVATRGGLRQAAVN